MLNKIKVLGIIALVAVIGFSMAACDNGDDGGDIPIIVPSGGGGGGGNPESGTPGLKYTLIAPANTEYEVSKGTATAAHVVIPPVYEGKPVTKIADYAFYTYSASLTSVTIPGSVKTIGNAAFADETGLTSVAIGSGVTVIADQAFQGCSSLTSITIPDGVTSIGASTFWRSGLTGSITIPGSVTSIGQDAFYSLNLTSVTFGPGSNMISNVNSDFASNAFPQGTNSGGNNLRTAYLAANPKAGTYTRDPGGTVWTKVN